MDDGTRSYRAPGRVNLIGEHTDHTGGLVLPAAIDRAVTLVGRPGGDRIRLRSRQFPGDVDVPADGSEAPAEGWGRYVAGIASELAAVGRRPVGFDGELDSDLPAGAGLSSSAALEVVVGVALADVADLRLAPLELADLARVAEHRAVGVPVGIMDQAASLLGRAGHAVLLDCGRLTHELVALPDVELLVVDSGVSRTLEGSGYAQRRAELEESLHVLRGRRPADVDEAELDGLLAGLPAVPARRLRHVVTENARVRRVVDALRAGSDPTVLAEAFAASHASLRDDFEVSTPELDRLVELAIDGGALAARMTGGGFGGAIVALVHPDRVDEVAEAVVSGYDDPTAGRRATVHRCVAADGAGRL